MPVTRALTGPTRGSPEPTTPCRCRRLSIGAVAVTSSFERLAKSGHKAVDHRAGHSDADGRPDRQIWLAAISRLLSELRRKSVHVHFVVLVVRPRSDGAFNHVTHSVD